MNRGIVSRVGLFLVLATISLWRLDAPVFWSDEGDTAFLARSIAKTGLPYAWDGRNALLFHNCLQLSRQFLSRMIPWTQYYVAYLSGLVFGESTAGYRCLFVLIGISSFFPLGLLLKRRVRFPWATSLLLLLLPQTLLFDRNARYYPLLTFETMVLLWAALECGSRPRLRRVIFAVFSILLFHTNPLTAVGTLLGMSAFYALRRPPSWPADLAWLWAGAPTWALWCVSLPGFSDVEPTFLSLLWSAPDVWLWAVGNGVVRTFSDLDYVGVFPALPCFALFFVIFFVSPPERRKRPIDPLVTLGVCVSLSLILLIAATAGTETDKLLAILRYMPQVCLLLPLTAILCAREIKIKPAPLPQVILIFGLFTNTLSLGVVSRSAPISWWPAVYGEILRGRATSLEPSPDLLSKSVTGPGTPALQIVPDYMEPVYVAYLGDRYRIRPALDPASQCAAALKSLLGTDQWEALTRGPELRIDLANRSGIASGTGHFPFPMWRAPNSSRPELTRHEFAGPGPTGWGEILGGVR